MGGQRQVCWSQSKSPPAATCSIIKTSALPLPHCQIVISAHSACSDSGPCLQSDFSSVLLLCPGFPTLSSLGCPPDLLTLSQPLSLQPQPPHLVSCNPPKLPLTSTPSSPRVSINTLVTSSQSPRLCLLLGSPVPLRVTLTPFIGYSGALA